MQNAEDQLIEAYEAYADAIFRHCYFRVGQNRETALDLTQETFLKTWDYLAQGKKVEYLKAFLYRVAGNLLIDRSRKAQEALLEDVGQSIPEPSVPSDVEGIDHQLDRERILNTLDRLTADHREVFVLRYVDGFSPKEMAEILNESVNVVSVRLHRATTEVRHLVQEKYGT